MDDLDLQFQFFGEAYQRHHDFRAGWDAFFLHFGGGFEDGEGLHFADFGVNDAESATAMA